jgi:hypothetical protein
MPSLIQRITQLSKSKQGRSVIRQVQQRISGSGQTGGRRGGRRNRGR